VNQVVIRIIDNDNNVLGDLDLANFNDFPLVLTKGIVNLDNLKARTGTYSKTFKAPNTKNNADLLSNVDNINSRKDYRDALNRKPCVIIINDSEIERGFVQVSKVMNGFELDSFELVFFGDNVDWVKRASELKLNTINWADNIQNYTSLNINTVNNGSSSTNDIAYPYISRGGNLTSNTATVEDYKPVFYMKSIITTGLNDLGYNVESSFLNSSPIDTLVCDFPLRFNITDDEAGDTDAFINRSQADIVLSLDSYFRLDYNVKVSPFYDNGNNYNTTTNEYTVPSDGTYVVGAEAKAGLSGGGPAIDVEMYIVVNGDSSTSIGSGTIIATKTLSAKTSVSSNLLPISTTYSFSAGDKVSVYISPKTTGLGTFVFTLQNGNNFRMYRKTNIVEGDIYSLNNVLPTDYKLLDVINDFTRMFNIYYWTDIKTRKIYFEPRDSFFKSKTTSIDWTEKLSIDQKYEVNYVSEYKRNIKFGYKDLNNDEWLKGWQDENKRTYGDYNHILPDRFTEGTVELRLSTFSSAYGQKADEVTPLTNGVFNPYESIVTIREWGEDIQVQPEERIDNYNPKVYFFKNGSQDSLDSTNRLINNFGVPTTDIPYGIFESYGNTDTPLNLSFTDGTKSDGTLEKGLFNTYYSSMMKNIEEGGRLIAYFDLSNVDIENLDFRNLVYIDYPTNVKGYYLVESVIDYNPIKNGLTKVSLFKFENLGSVPIDESQDGNNDDTIDNGNNPDILEPIYIQDSNNILIPVFSEDAVTGLIEPVFR